MYRALKFKIIIFLVFTATFAHATTNPKFTCINLFAPLSDDRFITLMKELTQDYDFMMLDRKGREQKLLAFEWTSKEDYFYFQIERLQLIPRQYKTPIVWSLMVHSDPANYPGRGSNFISDKKQTTYHQNQFNGLEMVFSHTIRIQNLPGTKKLMTIYSQYSSESRKPPNERLFFILLIPKPKPKAEKQNSPRK